MKKDKKDDELLPEYDFDYSKATSVMSCIECP
jgi:hypothetical protein